MLARRARAVVFEQRIADAKTSAPQFRQVFDAAHDDVSSVLPVSHRYAKFGLYALLATGAPNAIVVGTLIAFAAGWGWPGLFNFAVVHSNPSAPAAATGVTQTGASAGAAIGPLIFGLIVQFTSYNVGWIACGVIAVAALIAIVAGRTMLIRHQTELESVR